MEIASLAGRPASSILRRSLVGGLLAGIGVIVGLPVGDALACDIAGPATVYVEDLPQVLESDGSVISPAEYDDDATPPEVNGAVRIEVVEETPENAEYLSGAVLKTTKVWGEAEIAPVEVQEPVRKADATDCDWGAPSLGTTYYYLSGTEDESVSIIGDTDPDTVDAMLDELFGPSVTVTDGTAEAVSPGSDRSEPGAVIIDAARPGSQTPIGVFVVFVGAVLAAATVAIVLIVRRGRPRSAT